MNMLNFLLIGLVMIMSLEVVAFDLNYGLT